jgi:hypothetical protein
MWLSRSTTGTHRTRTDINDALLSGVSMTARSSSAHVEEHLVDIDKPIWGIVDIASAINKTPKATAHLLRQGRVPATKNGKLWISSLRRLRELTAAETAVAAE